MLDVCSGSSMLGRNNASCDMRAASLWARVCSQSSEELSLSSFSEATKGGMSFRGVFLLLVEKGRDGFFPDIPMYFPLHSRSLKRHHALPHHPSVEHQGAVPFRYALPNQVPRQRVFRALLQNHKRVFRHAFVRVPQKRAQIKQSARFRDGGFRFVFNRQTLQRPWSVTEKWLTCCTRNMGGGI